MANIKEIYRSLCQKGVYFKVEEGRLTYQAQAGSLCNADLNWIAMHLPEIALLTLKNRLQVVQELYQLCRKFERTQPHYKHLPKEYSCEIQTSLSTHGN